MAVPKINPDKAIRMALVAGRLDNQERVPWKRAPMTYEQYARSGLETPEQAAYWEGFYGGAGDAMASACRRAANED